MKKEHEIGRFKDGVSWIRVVAQLWHPEDSYPVSEVVHLYFTRSKKTAKKKYGKDMDIYDACHVLNGKTFNMVIIRKLANMFENYFDTYKPKYIMHGAYGYGPEHDKRLKAYQRTIFKAGYELFHSSCDEWGDKDYYYKRIRN
jgi:hypothetical protein